MAGSIRDPGWWQPHLPQLRREFAELTMDILIAGGDAGAGAIRAGSALVDWDVFNEDALSWLDMYLGGAPIPGLTSEGAYAWAFMLNDTTRRGVVREIDSWVRSGAPLPELEQRLGSFFDAKRAHRVAVTEVTRIYAAGNVTAWKASGVVSGKRWRTAVDENVCPICSRLNGKFVELDRGWEFNEAMLAADPALKRALGAPLTVVVPPAHVMCRCWLQPVVFEALTDEERAEGGYTPTPQPGPAPTAARPARPSWSPSGQPVSQALIIPKDSKNRAMYQRTAALIDQVHGDGNLPPLTVGTRRLKPGTYGIYTASRQPYISITSDILGGDKNLALTLAHEVGHFLDHRGIDSYELMATTDNNVTSEWRDAVRQTRAVERLMDSWENPVRNGVDIDGFPIYPRRSHLDYLLSPSEMWARSYSQYIALRSGDPDLLAAIAAERADPLYGARQWDDDDFEPVAAAFDSLFEVLGWLKRL